MIIVHYRSSFFFGGGGGGVFGNLRSGRIPCVLSYVVAYFESFLLPQ